MSDDRFSEVTHTSWGSRIKTSFKGILFGLLFFFGAFPLLFWNEGRAVKRYQTLKEGEGAVMAIASDRVDPANQGRLVHLSGTADTQKTLTDRSFGISQTALRLKRTVEMFQWKEERHTRTEKKAGGGEKTVTTYSYTRGWSPSVIRSSGFKRPDGHENPSSMPYPSQSMAASPVTVGAFVLPPFLVRTIDNWAPVSIDASAPIPSVLGADGTVLGNGYFRGRDPGNPSVGDIRITFEAVYPGPVSLIAAQQGQSFGAYTTKTGGAISLLQTGHHSAADMFKTAHFHNRLLTWGIRAGGLLLMFIGLAMLLKPLSVVADAIPLVGSLIEAGTGIVAFILALFFGLMVMGVAWIFYRPVLGLALMGAGVALVIGVVYRRQGGHHKTTTVTTSSASQPAAAGSLTQPRHGPDSLPPPPPTPPQRPKTPPVAHGSNLTGEAWIKSGKEAYVAGRFNEAAAAFEHAAAQAPDNGTAWYNLGVVRNKTGNAPGAIDAFKRAAGLGHPRAQDLLGAQHIDW